MIKRIFAILLALCVMFSAVLCFADEGDEDDDWDDDDDSGLTSFEEEEQKDSFKTVSTYNIKTETLDDFNYKMNSDGSGAILTSYIGEETDVVFPSAVGDVPVVEIDNGMCQDNPVLKSIRIPGTIRRIGNAAFSRCPNLKTIVIEEGVEEIGLCSFGGCPELTDIQLPDSLIKVDNAGFAFCGALEEVTFGTKLESIGAQAFSGCASLVRIVLPGGDRVTIPENVFDHEVEIVVP